MKRILLYSLFASLGFSAFARSSDPDPERYYNQRAAIGETTWDKEVAAIRQKAISLIESQCGPIKRSPKTGRRLIKGQWWPCDPYGEDNNVYAILEDGRAAMLLCGSPSGTYPPRVFCK